MSTRASLSNRTVSAAQWRMATSVVQGVLQFGVGVLLARLLEPEAFGLLALAYVLIGLAGIASEAGLGLAVIQRRPLTQLHVRVAYTGSLLMGAAVALAVWAVATPAALLLGDPRLEGVLRALSLLFLVGGAGATARGLMRRDLQFRRLFTLELASYGIGYAGVAVPMALSGYGVWSLVGGTLVQSLLGTLIALRATRHPLRPALSLGELRDLVSFGGAATLNQAVNYVARNGDTFIVGSLLGPHLLGLYGRAYHLVTLPLGYVGDVMWQVLFPAMSEVAGDRERIGRAYLLAVQGSALFAAPLMAGLAVVAPHLVAGLYGPRWTGTVLPLQILCLAGALRSVYHVSGALTHASGRVLSEAGRQSGYAALVVAGAWGGSRFGLGGVAVGIVLATVFMYLAMGHLSLRITRLGWGDFFGAQAPGIVLAVAVAVPALGVRTALELGGAGSLLILLALVLTCACALAAGLHVLPGSLRPVELYRRLDRPMTRLPGRLRLTVTRVLGVSPA